MTNLALVAIAGCPRMLLGKLTHHNFAVAYYAVPKPYDCSSGETSDL